MTSLTKLRELQEQASPGPWRVEFKFENVWVVWYKKHRCVLDAHTEANAKLAALATHLLPLAEALAKVHADDFLATSHDCTANAKAGHPTCKALKALTEALDE